MKITIGSICWQGSPLFWEYNKEENTIRCLYVCKASPAIIDKQLLLPLFQQFSDITLIDDDQAIIADAKSFLTNNQHTFVDEEISPRHVFFQGPIKTAPAAIPTRKPSPPPILSPRHFSSSPGFSTSPRSSTSPRPLLSPRIPYSSMMLSLTALIPNNESKADIWRQTLCYEGDFIKKTKSDADSRKCSTIQSEASLLRENQYKKNKMTYPKKRVIIETIRYIFDKLLGPTFHSAFKGSAPSKALEHHFQQAIVGIMTKSPVEIMPTEAEIQPDLYECDLAREFAIEEAKRARANTKLRHLLFFVDHSIAAEHICTDVSVIKTLEVFREKLTPIVPHIKSYIDKLREHMVQLAKIETLIKQQEIQLLESINNHHPIVSGYHSFYFMMKQTIQLVSEYTPPEDVVAQLVSKITRLSIEKIRITFNPDHPQTKGNIAPLNPEQNDFYISPELNEILCRKLQSILTKINPGKLISNERQLGIIIEAVIEAIHVHIASMTFSPQTSVSAPCF